MSLMLYLESSKKKKSFFRVKDLESSEKTKLILYSERFGVYCSERKKLIL